jgi:hypothetical protein
MEPKQCPLHRKKNFIGRSALLKRKDGAIVMTSQVGAQQPIDYLTEAAQQVARNCLEQIPNEIQESLNGTQNRKRVSIRKKKRLRIDPIQTTVRECQQTTHLVRLSSSPAGLTVYA